MITVTTAAPSNKLITRTLVKSRLGITSTGDDALLDGYIQAASDAIEMYCSRKFGKQAYTETLDADGLPFVKIYHYPVISVTEVKVFGTTTTGYLVEDSDAGILFVEDGFPNTRSYVAGGPGGLEPQMLPAAMRRQISVKYKAGYKLPDDTSTGGTAEPKNLELAAYEAVKSFYIRRKRDDSARSKTLGPLSISYGSLPDIAETELPLQAKALLRAFERRDVGLY